MTTLWADGFDHYGTTIANILDGAWAQADAPFSISSANPRTGTGHLRTGGTTGFVRRVFGAAKVTVGVGYAFYMGGLPTNDDRLTLFEFRDAANVAHVNISVTTTGAIKAVRGAAGGTLLSTSSLLLTSGAYNHIEAKVKIDNATGTLEVRVNGVVFLNLSGIDTQNTANAETSQFVMGGSATTGSGPHDWDDINAWDTAGSVNNNFLGDRICSTVYPVSDDAAQAWVENTGTDGFAMLDESSPDNDTTYVETPAGTGHISEYGLGDLPTNMTLINAVYMVGRFRKTDAAACDVVQSMLSNGVAANGGTKALTTAYTYYGDVVENDPNTAAPWSRTSFNAAHLRINRTG